MDLNELIRRNYVARYPTPAVEALLPQYRAFIDPRTMDPCFWSEHGISYNTSLVPQGQGAQGLGRSLQPFFKGSVSFDPTENRFLSGLNAMLGEDRTRALLECIGGNDQSSSAATPSAWS